jgi:tetratricopeptide (TPR) repeat protein
MQTPRTGTLPGLLATLVLSSVTLACGGASKDGASEDKTAAKAPPAADTKANDVEAPAADGAAASAEGGAVPPPVAGDETGGTGPGPGATASGPPPGVSGPPAAADDTGGSGADETAGGSTGGAAAVDVPALLKEIKSKKTKDARAQEALAEAEAAGAEPADVAKALNARGLALFADPERAKTFFELASEKDPKYPDAAFNLAKQAAVVGELDEAKKWLTIVKERKGKKLLKQIDFDPMWEILKDDPDVRALLR